MFGRWLFVRLTAAEHALRDGRIDDAYAVAMQPDVRQHARGQRLADALARPLLARARLHRQAGQYREALADLERLAALERLSPEAVELHRQVSQEMEADAVREAERRATYQQAAEQLQAGRLETLRAHLERVSDAAQRGELAEELRLREQRAAQLLTQATAALERGDVLGAARYWQEATQRHGRTQQTDDFAARLAHGFRQSVATWLDAGRVDQVLAAQEQLTPLAVVQPVVGECTRLAAICARAARQLAEREFGELRETLLRLKAMRAQAAWVATALQALGQIADGQEVLLAGPLGTAVSLWGSGAPLPDGGPGDASSAEPVPGGMRVERRRPLLLIVDGGESSLLVDAGQARIGRQGAADVDVPIPADLLSHHADVARVGEDYFLTAYGPAQVNQRPVRRSLLRDGDRVKLGQRAKLVFNKPSAKSESAVLRLSHRCRLAQDVSSIVLFRDTCLIGRGPTCHVRRLEGEAQGVLFERRGALYLRLLGSDGQGESSVRPVRDGETLELGDLRVTVKPYAAPLADSGA